MKRVAGFFKSIFVFVVVVLLQTIIVTSVNFLFSIQGADTGGSFFDRIIEALNNSASTSQLSQLSDFIYAILALIIFGLWYRHAFIKPFRGRKNKNYPTGFSFHTVMAILFLGIGLQYVTLLVVNIASAFRPEWLTTYNEMMAGNGYANPGFILILYTVILAPVAEETVFRGLIFRYGRQAFPFWVANVWQALLFGLAHGNWMQGIYAFVMGLFLGFICHRGRGVKYSILVHIVYNIVGLWFSGLIEITTSLGYALALTLGVILAIFAVWLFYTDFTPATTKTEKSKREKPE